MFGFFNDPFEDAFFAPRRRQQIRYVYDPFFGYVPVQVQQRPRPRPRIQHYYFDPFFGLLNSDYSEDEEVEEKPKKEEPKQEETPAPKPAEEETKEESKKEEVKEEKPQIVEKKSEPKMNIWSRSSVFSGHSRGGIEEIHEKTFDSKTGETVESQTRRIGDRWCRIDTTTQKDGHSVSKETWHNVSLDEQEKFKEEWVARRGLKNKETKAVKQEEAPKEAVETKKEEPAEETKPETTQ